MATSAFMKKTLDQQTKVKALIKEKIEGDSVLTIPDPALQWGTGGWVRGRCNLLYGPSGSGKSTLSQMGAGLEQKRTNGYVIVFDSEYAYKDPNDVDEHGKLTEDAQLARARLMLAGIDPDKFLLIQSNQVDILFGSLSDLEKDIKSKALHVSAIIVDSWGGVQSEAAQKKIEEGDIGSVANSFGGNAKLMGPILQSLLRIAAETGTTMFFVQHCIQSMEQYGPRWVMVGGEKLKYLVHGVTFVETINAKDAHLLAGGQVSESSKDEELVHKVGKKIRFACDKSRANINGRKGEFWMDFDKIQFALPEVSLFNLAAKLGVIGHPSVAVLNDSGPDKGKQKLDPKSGEPVFKTLDAYWEFPAGAPGAKKWHGQGQTIAAIKADKALFEDVMNNCLDNKHKDALKGEKIGEELNNETEKNKKSRK